MKRGIGSGGWVAVVATLWLIRLWTLNGLPFAGEPIWMGWFDQSRYFASATAFARGDLSPAAHWYPLAYPLLAAPIAWIVPRDPFLPLDLILYLVACHAFRNVAARLQIGPALATGCFVLTTLIDATVARGWVDPWTTTLSAALIWSLADQMLRIVGSEGASISRRQAILFGAVAAAIPLVRPVDVLVAATGVAVVAIVLLRARSLSIRLAALTCVGAAAVIAAYAALHLAIYGAQATPYMIAASRTGFIWADFGWKAYVLLIHAEPWFPDTLAVFERMPWIAVGIAGLIATAITGGQAVRRTIAILALLAIPVSAVMLTYADLQPPGLWRFGNIHYFKWVLPLVGLGVILCVRLALVPGRRAMLAGIVAACLLPLGIRVVPQPVDDSEPARMLTFAGDTGRVWDEAYFAPVTIVDTGGRLANINGFHQVPDADGQRAIAVSRLFLSDPRRSDPGETLRAQPQAPTGRFAGRLTFLGL
ncbi:hypothetical protein ACFSC3_08430 [Sphingomonas floccifaciens]|uniref:Glycosyltransferase RgtA/B/C/D-like domain-containing protein n=1 Tax=Sphingomonas floccifaciens TaxID=1844115 RepID=A0ABW4NCR4_9SPHN